MIVKNLIEKLKEFNPEANIYFTLDLNSDEGYPIVEVVPIIDLQLAGVLHKAEPPNNNRT